MNYFDLFASGFLLSLSLCLDIGTVNVALINTAIRSGMRAGMLLGLGSCFGDLIYALLSLVGIGLLLQIEWLRELISIGGIAVLLYLAFDALRAALRDESAAIAVEPTSQLPPHHLFTRGLLLSLASPTAILWFAAAGGSMIAHSNAQSSSGFFALFGGFFVGGFSWCLFITGLSARGGKLLGNKFRRICSLASAGLFVYFAVRVGHTMPIFDIGLAY